MEAIGYQVLLTTENLNRWNNFDYAVLTGHLDGYVPLVNKTIYKNKALYCLKHGYDLRVVRNIRSWFKLNGTHGDGFSWSRLYEMLELVESGDYKWVWCVGADTLVTNMNVKLESFTQTDKHVVIAGEAVAPIQADSFLVRSSPEGTDFLRRLLDTWPKYNKHPWVENQAMIDLRHEFKDITQIVPQSALNSYDYSHFYHLTNHNYRTGLDCYGNRGQWVKGDFLIHWAGLSMEVRADMLKFYEPMIVNGE